MWRDPCQDGHAGRLHAIPGKDICSISGTRANAVLYAENKQSLIRNEMKNTNIHLLF